MHSFKIKSFPVTEPRWLELSTFEAQSGLLTYGESESAIPFSIQRFFYIYGIPTNAVRGGHAHFQTHEAVFCLSGAATIRAFSANNKEYRFRLECPSQGIYLPPLWWVMLEEFSQNSILLVLASSKYLTEDYIREPEAFFHKKPYPVSGPDQ